MAITNGYATLLQLKAELGIPATNVANDTKLELAMASASRQIDHHTGRTHGFWVDSTVVVREFFAYDSYECPVDDISTATGLIVKTDTAGDGTYASTLIISTDFILQPSNAVDRVPAWPYTSLLMVGSASFPVTQRRPGVQVTAKYGWPAVPDDVTKAALIQAVQNYKAADAVFGGLSFGDAGFMRVRASINPLAEALLEAYCKPRVA